MPVRHDLGNTRIDGVSVGNGPKHWTVSHDLMPGADLPSHESLVGLGRLWLYAGRTPKKMRQLSRDPVLARGRTDTRSSHACCVPVGRQPPDVNSSFWSLWRRYRSAAHVSPEPCQPFWSGPSHSPTGPASLILWLRYRPAPGISLSRSSAGVPSRGDFHVVRWRIDVRPAGDAASGDNEGTFPRKFHPINHQDIRPKSEICYVA